MPNATSCPGGRWCERADALLGVEGIHVCSVATTAADLILHVETDESVSGCPDCGVVAVVHGRRQVQLHDTPCFGRPVRLLWAKRVWRCPDPGCPRTTFTEEHPLAGPAKISNILAEPWVIEDGRVVPKSVDVSQKNGGKRLEAMYLYADLADSTLLPKRLP